MIINDDDHMKEVSPVPALTPSSLLFPAVPPNEQPGHLMMVMMAMMVMTVMMVMMVMMVMTVTVMVMMVMIEMVVTVMMLLVMRIKQTSVFLTTSDNQ